MELTPRLRAIAQQVPQGSVLADVGTDHALLPAWLLLEGRIPSAIASDLREGPLARAKETVEQHGVADRVSLRLCDGLSGIQAGEADVVAIAGMGGETIAAILEQAPWTKENTLLLLQPMTSFPYRAHRAGRSGCSHDPGRALGGAQHPPTPERGIPIHDGGQGAPGPGRTEGLCQPGPGCGGAAGAGTGRHL